MGHADWNRSDLFRFQVLDAAFASTELAEFLVKDVIERFRGFGGVRIEDDVIINKTGMELMTDVPRTVDEIEGFMAESHKE